MAEVACPILRSSEHGVIARVNRAIDLIVTHLPEPLPLERVADAAHCSPFHFHRLFKRVTGETLTAFVTRMRLERALHRLAHGPAGTLTEIALDAGFNSASDFSRRFRAQYGIAPSRFDLDAYRRERRGALDALSRIDRTLEPADGNTDAIDVVVRELPARTVAYVRVLDPYRADVVSAAAKRLEEWADATGHGDGIWLGYMWDDPEIVPLERCRYEEGTCHEECTLRVQHHQTDGHELCRHDRKQAIGGGKQREGQHRERMAAMRDEEIERARDCGPVAVPKRGCGKSARCSGLRRHDAPRDGRARRAFAVRRDGNVKAIPGRARVASAHADRGSARR